MKSFTTRRFHEMYANLPTPVRSQAVRAYRLFRGNPSHPGLSFKKVDEIHNIYSAGISRGYRALGKLDGNDIVWFWIGSHAEYDRMI